MYQDPEVAQIIRRLDERKREAVQRERYDHAKKLKQAIADLQKVRLPTPARGCGFSGVPGHQPQQWGIEDNASGSVAVLRVTR